VRRVWDRLEQNLELAEELMHVVAKRERVAWLVDIFALDKMKYAVVEHVKYVKRSLFQGMLETR
jgi:hypothetical protein